MILVKHTDDMKISVLITNGAKQVMLTPEGKHEREALKLINPKGVLKVVSRWGSFADEHSHLNYQVAKCEGGYYRAFETTDSLMFVIEEEDETTK